MRLQRSGGKLEGVEATRSKNAVAHMNIGRFRWLARLKFAGGAIYVFTFTHVLAVCGDSLLFVPGGGSPSRLEKARRPQKRKRQDPRDEGSPQCTHLASAPPPAS